MVLRGVCLVYMLTKVFTNDTCHKYTRQCVPPTY